MQREIANFFKPFYSAPFYADLLQNWKGIGMGFILLVAFVDFTALAVPLGQFMPGFSQMMSTTASQLPKVTIKEGILSIDQPSPYMIKQGQVKPIVFDTSDAAKDMGAVTKALEEGHVGIFVTSEFMAYKKTDSALEIQRFDKPGFKDIVIDHDRWVSTIALILKYGVAAIIILIGLMFIVGVFIITFIKAFIVKLAALFFNNKPDFSGNMRLAAAAALPPASILTLFGIVQSLTAMPVKAGEIAPASIELPYYLGFVIWLGLVLFGLASNDKTPKAG
ncbi:MAG: DUF1189 domain-containing protein [Alphaproteobacteria bacterium]|nr:DUF1189 domain-containing protein [Alphaproteobacteria bacterium]